MKSENLSQQEHPLRCFCESTPVLGTYGLDEHGELYVHIIIRKNKYIHGEVIARGDVQLMCRICLRWHTIKIVQPDKMRLKETQTPRMLVAGQ